MKKNITLVYSSDQMSKISLVFTPIVHNDDDDDWWWRWPPEWLSHQSECPRQDWCSSTPSAALADFSIEILGFLESRYKTKIFQKLAILTATTKSVHQYISKQSSRLWFLSPMREVAAALLFWLCFEVQSWPVFTRELYLTFEKNISMRMIIILNTILMM